MRALGKRAEAEGELRTVLELQEATLGESHVATKQTRRDIAEVTS